MAKKTPKNPKGAGRPQIEIDWVSFDKLCAIQCTLVEIADFFDCSEDTIERAVKRKWGVNFAEHFKKKSAGGKISLRRSMFDKALKGNTTMQIWLSKNYLGMTDKVEQTHNTNETLTDILKSISDQAT